MSTASLRDSRRPSHKEKMRPAYLVAFVYPSSIGNTKKFSESLYEFEPIHRMRRPMRRIVH